MDNELSSVNPQLNEIVVPTGSRLPWTPEFRGNLQARYDFRMEVADADAYVRGAMVYTGDSLSGSSCNAYFVEDVTRQVFGTPSGLSIENEGGFCGTPLTGDDLASVTDQSFIGVDGNGDTRFRAGRYEQEDYVLVNFAAGLQWESWKAEVFVNNVFDEEAMVNINASDYTPSVGVARPRTVGIRVSYDHL